MILIIDNNKKAARNLADMFLYMGFLAYSVTADATICELSTAYKAVIIISPSSIAEVDELISNIKDRVPRIPVFALCAKEDTKYSRLFDGIMERGAFASSIISRIIEYADANSLAIPGHYEYLSLDASADLRCPLYRTTPVSFTKTECMILRYLIVTAPHSVTARQILIHAYRPSRMPDISNIRTHVSIINKKFRQMTGMNLIAQSTGEGYRIELQTVDKILAEV